ncbi:MAG: MotA/TolQ/ExbB proton channel family protein [Planctomycetaceae bacterium]|nr:MotA/TolQ/ExbB proton channel family protein [Planctomycetaceae bacterium]
MSSKQTSRPTLPYNIVMPILLGLAAFIVLFASINNGTIDNEMVTRYLAGHTVSKVTTAMFFVGLASLMFILCDIIRQRSLLSKISLAGNAGELQVESAEEGGTPTTDDLQSRLERHQGRRRRSYFWRRLYTALDFVQRNGSPDGLEEELKYASELDQDEKHDRYSFAKILVWAIPMLGFLGTVLGISEALGGLEIGEDNDFQEMMGGLRSSLYVAFDTTAIALTFAILLMFTMFAVDRSESGLLTQVESRTREELLPHWELTNQAKDSYVQAVEAIGAQVLGSTEQLVDRQVKLWRANIDAAESAWVESVRSTQTVVQQNLESALNTSTESLGNRLRETIQKSDEAVGRRWEQWQVALSENARLLASHQQQLVEYSKNMMQSLENIGSLAETKQAIADYLENVPLSAEYSDASDKLATAVRLLEFRLTQLDAAETNTEQGDSGSDTVRHAA